MVGLVETMLGSSEKVESAMTRSWRIRKALLVCGIAGPLLFVATDILAGTRWKGYGFVSRSISELSAVGAPTRPLVVPLNLAAEALLIAFALGVWGLAGRSRSARVTAVMLFGSAAFQLMGAFYPVHLGESLTTPANTVNTVLIGTSVLFLMLAIGFGAVAQRGWFRLYSVVTFLVFALAGVLATRHNPVVLAGQRGPLVGAQERSMMYGCMLWVALLAIVLPSNRRSFPGRTEASAGKR